MINFDVITRENIKEYHWNWPQIPVHSYRILIIGDSGSWKTNALVKLTSHQPDNDNFLCDDPHEAKREGVGLKYHNGSKVFIEYSNTRMI